MDYEEEYLTPKDVEKILRICHTTASKLINRPDFPAVRIGHCVRINRQKFNEFMERYNKEIVAI